MSGRYESSFLDAFDYYFMNGKNLGLAEPDISEELLIETINQIIEGVPSLPFLEKGVPFNFEDGVLIMSAVGLSLQPDPEQAPCGGHGIWDSALAFSKRYRVPEGGALSYLLAKFEGGMELETQDVPLAEARCGFEPSEGQSLMLPLGTPVSSM